MALTFFNGNLVCNFHFSVNFDKFKNVMLETAGIGALSVTLENTLMMENNDTVYNFQSQFVLFLQRFRNTVKTQVPIYEYFLCDLQPRV